MNGKGNWDGEVDRGSGRGDRVGKGEGVLDLDICPGPPSS